MTMGRARRGGSRWDDRPRRGQEEAFPRCSRGRGVDACFTCRSQAANQESAARCYQRPPGGPEVVMTTAAQVVDSFGAMKQLTTSASPVAFAAPFHRPVPRIASGTA